MIFKKNSSVKNCFSETIRHFLISNNLLNRLKERYILEYFCQNDANGKKKKKETIILVLKKKKHQTAAICMKVKKLQLAPDIEQCTGSKLGKGMLRLYIVTLFTYMHSTSCEMLGWVTHKLESRLLGEISTTSNMQMIPL